MKSLKELNELCNLIAEFKKPAWVAKNSDVTFLYRMPTKCAIYSDNKGLYYVYKFISKAKIEEHKEYESAAKSFNIFVVMHMER